MPLCLSAREEAGPADVRHEVLYSSTQEEQHEKQQRPLPHRALPASLSGSSSGGSRVHPAPNLCPGWQQCWVRSRSTQGWLADAAGNDQKQSLGQVGPWQTPPWSTGQLPSNGNKSLTTTLVRPRWLPLTRNPSAPYGCPEAYLKCLILQA